jgi:chromate transporter
VLNLGVWFALHTLFTDPEERHFGKVRVYLPELASVNVASLLIALVAALLLLRLRAGMPKTLALCTLLGMAAFRLGAA